MIDFHLHEHEVHIWLANLDHPCFDPERLTFVLSPDEQQRATRFRTESHRTQYVARRMILRALLGGYMDQHPLDITFDSNAWGKPSLASPHDALQFNLAESDGLAVYAFSRARAVGIDLERIRPLPLTDAFIGRVCSPNERVTLASLPRQEQINFIFTVWACKEAFVKAVGRGLATPLDHFDVTPNGIVTTEPELSARVGAPTDWRVRALDIAPGYRSALAVESSQPCDVTKSRWDALAANQLLPLRRNEQNHYKVED